MLRVVWCDVLVVDASRECQSRANQSNSGVIGVEQPRAPVPRSDRGRSRGASAAAFGFSINRAPCSGRPDSSGSEHRTSMRVVGDSTLVVLLPAAVSATGPTRSRTHAACRAPRRHTMPSAQAVVKCGAGARRTSVSQSWKATGHFFRLYLRPRCPGRGHNRRILWETGAPGRIRTCDPRLRRPCVGSVSTTENRE